MPRTRKIIKKEEIKEKDTTIKADIYNIEGQVIGKMQLSREIFAVKIIPELLAQSVRVHQANQRLGTHYTKTRSQVSGSTRKIYRQKGTGRARHGDIKAPIFIGGGVAHGPKTRDYSLKLPKKMKRLALFGALTSKLGEGKIKIISGLDKIELKTKKMLEILRNLQLEDAKKRIPFNSLLVLPEKIQNIILSTRNIPGIDMIDTKLLNTYEVLAHQNILFMKEALPILFSHFLNKENRQKDISSEKSKEQKGKRKKEEILKPSSKQTTNKKTVKKEKVVKRG